MVSFVNNEKNKSPFSLGDLYKSDVSKDFADKIGVDNPFKAKQGDGPGFLDNFKKGMTSYQDLAKKSDTDKMIDFYKDALNKQGSPTFGDASGAYSKELAQGLTTFVPAGSQQVFIPGQKGNEGVFSLGGAIRGGIGGFMKGGPAGALGGAAMGGFM